MEIPASNLINASCLKLSAAVSYKQNSVYKLLKRAMPGASTESCPIPGSHINEPFLT